MRISNLLAPVVFLSAFALFPFGSPALAAALVDINTADETLLETLPHVGQTFARRIIDYRTANGPFARVEDLQNVRGIGSGKNYDDIAPLITVGGALSTTDASGSNASSTVPRAQDAPVSSTGAATYVPPSTALSIDVGADRSAVLETPLHLSASVKTKGGAPDSSAYITWGFGDGSSATGSSVEKTYRYAGTYLVTATVTNGIVSAEDELMVVAKPALVRISALSGDGVEIANDASERLDLSGWRISAETGSFRIPNGTVLLPQANVLFPSNITNLPVVLSATLSYPDGIIAARYPAPTSTPPTESVQPFAPVASSTGEQTVESVFSSGVSDTAHEVTAVGAPAAATELAAAGAALPAPATSAPAAGILHSPWFLSLLGVITLAGGAFIFL